MPLFDDLDRSHTRPALHAEPTFKWLNHSARDDVARLRETYEEWFDRYPEEDQDDLRARFQSSDDVQHEAAAFELLLHEVLVSLGYGVDVHPETESDVAGRPDFRADPSDGNPFYLEASLATGKSDAERAAEQRKAEVYDLLDDLSSENFFLGVTGTGIPNSPPPTSRMRDFLEERMRTLNPDEIADLYEEEGREALPTWDFDLRGWNVEFHPIPKSPEARGEGDRTLGIFSQGEAEYVQPADPVRETLSEKAGSYGDLDLPLVVAVNATSAFDWRAFEDALFGEQVAVFPATGDVPAGDPRPARRGNGVWYRGDHPGSQGLSAVIGCLRLMPWSPTRSAVRVYHNPWAERPLEGQLEPLPNARITDEGQLDIADGETLGVVVGLPKQWPEEDT